MAKLTAREQVGESQRLGDKATGLWFTIAGSRRRFQRYDEAPPYDGTTHWYAEEGGPWRAFRNSDVKLWKPKRKRQRRKK